MNGRKRSSHRTNAYSNTLLIGMANTKSAAKRARQTQRLALRNRSVKAHLRSLQKRARSAPAPNADEIRAVISAIDKAAKRGMIHSNTANRRKARLYKALVAAT